MATSTSLPGVYGLIEEALGREQALKVGSLFEGEMVYFPVLERALRRERNRRILEEFNGSNHRELSKKYRLSLRHIYFILHGK